MTIDLENYKKELLYLKGEYQKVIKLNKEISFGIEIEFAGIELDKMLKYVDKYINKIDSNSAFEYRIWNVINELTVEKRVYDKILGGEIVSPILHNDEASWKSIKKITSLFNLQNFYLSEDCSLHVHFGEKNFSNFRNNSSPLLCTPQFIFNLFKIWMVFEDIIYRTCYGSKLQERPKIMKYAPPTGYKIYKNLNSLYNEEQIIKFVENYRIEKDYGLNLKNLKYFSKKTIEIRCPNAMETIFLIQNTIRFLARLLEYCDSDEFDSEKIEYYIKKYKPMNIEDFRKENFYKAEDLANMIYDDELDKMYFLKQYLKCFTKEELIDKQKIL